MKKKTNTRQIRIKNGRTKYNISKGGSVRLRSKVPFSAKRKRFNIMLASQVERTCVPDLGSAETEGALALSCPS